MSRKPRPTVTRRRFIKGVAGAAMAMPLLEFTAPRAHASDSFPTRLLFVYKPNGVVKERWSPAGGERDFSFDGTTLAPLQRHRESLVVLDGIQLASASAGAGGPHQRGMATLLTGQIIRDPKDGRDGGEREFFVGGDGRAAGWGDGISIDQFLARQLDPPTAFPSLELGVGVLPADAIPRGRISYRGPAQPVPPRTSPADVHRALFADVGMDRDDMVRLANRRQSVLDRVHRDFSALRGRVSRADWVKLEQHMTALEGIERQVARAPGSDMECTAPEAPLPFDEPTAEGNFLDVSRQQMDLLAMAFACDQTRIATLQYSSAKNNMRLPALGFPDDIHALSHAGDSDAERQRRWDAVNSWYAEELAYLLDRLASIPEGSGTLLDHTLVVWMSEITRGNLHSFDDMPFVLAGGANGHLETGRHLEMGGRSHTDLLIAIINMMGVESATFGHRDFVTGPMPGIFR